VQLIRSAVAAGALVAASLVPAFAPPAAAGPTATQDPEELVTGEVVSSSSRWARGKTAIVTESVLRTFDGREVSVRQLGGSVDGIGMIVLHSEPVLRRGDRVTARVALSRDLQGRMSRPVRALYSASPGGAGRLPFVRSEATETRAKLAWRSGCAQIWFHEDGTGAIDGELEFDEMERVLIRWRYDVQACSYFDLRFQGLDNADVGLDGSNMVIFRDEEWCVPATEDEPKECHDSAAAGLTTLFFIDDPASKRNGTILDADIELNGVDFNIAVDHQTAANDGLEADLANTFTHEVGHLMGLDHTCAPPGGIRLEDHQGEPIPICSPDPTQMPAVVREATMFAFQDPGETKKASPEPDDISGVCSIYPLDENPRECLAAELEPGTTCAVGSGKGALGGAGLIGFALLFGLRRRRR
jgi:MYXO-CTERM domain-containing protein